VFKNGVKSIQTAGYNGAHTVINSFDNKVEILQLNKYETAPYFLQLSQNLTSDYLLISVFLLVSTGKNSEINKQVLAYLKKIWNCLIFS
jgi:hypothetical protein